MPKKPNNPDWKDLVAPFAWLITRIIFRVFKRRWIADPKIPVEKSTVTLEEEDE